jgi:hypothetical protein
MTERGGARPNFYIYLVKPYVVQQRKPDKPKKIR